jgi:hypothetical protein
VRIDDPGTAQPQPPLSPLDGGAAVAAAAPPTHFPPVHVAPVAQSVVALHCCWQPPPTHRYGAQLCSFPSAVTTVEASLQVVEIAAHCPVPMSHFPPEAQSPSDLHDDRHAFADASQAYGVHPMAAPGMHLPEPLH